MSKITGTFEIYRRTDGLWGWRLKARNWCNVGPGQGYKTLRGAIRWGRCPHQGGIACAGGGVAGEVARASPGAADKASAWLACHIGEGPAVAARLSMYSHRR